MIYLDNAATTKLHPKALNAMIPYLSEEYGNPSANYSFGSSNKRVIENVRHIIATSINADDDEIYFTSGGTESDNTAIKCLLNINGIITTPIEHKAILNSLPRDSVIFLDINADGFVDIKSLDDIPLFNMLLSVMYANNETGVIQPIKEIGSYINSFVDLGGTVFHTDAVQAYCHIPIDVKAERIDMLSASAHKFNGPKGIGFLYINKDIKVNPLITGGGQERGFRSGTENVAAIVGMGEAVKIAMCDMDRNIKEVSDKRDYFESQILKHIDGVNVNGCDNRLPGHCNVTIHGINSEEVLEMLNSASICASSGSACSAKDAKPSYVLKAMGRSDKDANSSLRFSIGQDNTYDELDKVVDVLKTSVSLLRS